MFNALTLFHTDDEDWQPRICHVIMPDGISKDLNTWAPFLVGDEVYEEFTYYSVDLRTLIARCMADDREDRPTLNELLTTIQTSIARDDAIAFETERVFQTERAADPTRQRLPVNVTRPPEVEDDALLSRFFQEYIRDPPSREDPYGEFWDQ
ncbi:hypothetical protein F4813DRAFT_346649 [Daldinia decipiens]|uniref:uncharacterized protein n=1 Tax=Daldinia decipiens TaxID=326647 RepID=UPI0020C1FB6D|nr:uncharacterized protein F4813DRAFT_346649 [Daldinia decipiens]KAI1661173.1 hypothetical protein F4813DRAFT_346649 [Daldinia decipiens]